MSDEGQETIPEATETIRLPSPTWAPAVFAFGVLGLIAGTFATGFMFPALWYAIVGAFFVLFALRSLIRRGVRDYYALPRDQESPRAELPVESFTAPTID